MAGVKETISNVDPSVYDTAFVIENGKMVMQTDLDLNNNRFKNVPQPISNGDVLTKGSINIYNIKLYGTVNQRRVFTNNNIDIKFDSVFIQKITLYSRTLFRGVSDRILIKFRNIQGRLQIMNYRFVYSFSDITNININRNFIGSISNIELHSTHSFISFEISYRSIYI